MEITNVNITPMEDPTNEALLAFGSFVIDNAFAVHQIRLVDTGSRIIVQMPNERHQGEWQDIAHPINHDCRQTIREAVIREYNRRVPEEETIPLEPE